MACSFSLRPIDTHDLFFHALADSILYNGAATKRITQRIATTTHRAVDDKEDLEWSLDLPGVKTSDLTVSIDGDTIHVEGTRQIFGRGALRAEKKSRISKTFKVDPHMIDLSHLKANLSNGVLVLSAPKTPKEEPRKIEITTIDEPIPEADHDDKIVSTEGQHVNTPLDMESDESEGKKLDL